VTLSPYSLAQRAKELLKDEALTYVLDTMDREAFGLFKMANTTEEQRLYAYHLAQGVDTVRASLQTLVDRYEQDSKDSE
jgi:hypothetical protein